MHFSHKMVIFAVDLIRDKNIKKNYFLDWKELIFSGFFFFQKKNKKIIPIFCKYFGEENKKWRKY